MTKKNVITLLAIVVVLCLIYLFVFGGLQKTVDFFSGDPSNSQNTDENQNISGGLSPQEIMEIAKTDKDYNDLSEFVKDFDPKIVAYDKFGQTEYNNIKQQWQEQGLNDRIGIIDKIELTDSTYWIELKNKNNEDKGLRMIFDIKEKKSLLLIATLNVEAGVGI